jgi:hypothetical protein
VTAEAISGGPDSADCDRFRFTTEINVDSALPNKVMPAWKAVIFFTGAGVASHV